MKPLKGNGFLLRSFREGDETSLKRNINSRKIYRHTVHIPYPYTIKDAKKWIRHCKNKKTNELNFAIEIGGEVAGGISLMKIEGHRAEIGYWLGEKYWRRG